jgi:hypothetical protein
VKLITGCDCAEYMINASFHLRASDKSHPILALKAMDM